MFQQISTPNGWIFKKFDIWVLFENVSTYFKFHENLTIITFTLHENPFTFMITRRWIFLELCFRENLGKIEIHILCSVTFSTRESCRSWNNVEEIGRTTQATNDYIIRRFACWVNKAIDTHFHDNSGNANRSQYNVYTCMFVLFLQHWKFPCTA